MQKNAIIVVTVLSMFLAVGLLPAAASAATPQLNPPPSSLPAVTYYTSDNHYTITTTEWNAFFSSVIDNKSIVSYNWSSNATQELIVFDLSYLGINSYGLQLVNALSGIGFPSVANFTKAFWAVANKTSSVNGLTNHQALNAGAYPAFSWSKPKIHTPTQNYYYAGIIIALIAATFVLYFVFNRKK
ncbi:hypothetical protein IX51_02820 [uncultured archaeon]|nr:hypothetical protein IX51_02820 [uncultured archaeon]HKJ96972.1 hypothetical protein [Thermoplasmataceae archaeon]